MQPGGRPLPQGRAHRALPTDSTVPLQALSVLPVFERAPAACSGPGRPDRIRRGYGDPPKEWMFNRPGNIPRQSPVAPPSPPAASRACRFLKHGRRLFPTVSGVAIKEQDRNKPPLFRSALADALPSYR